ncbi:dipeptidase [Pontibacter harenae]|uniref:dipeptidase n=1 Tax=Pontibacter harenae TaxID=2894083 RepID=UPI001E4592C0|nr:dipeptidase [Pontibacter harenae]MCC9168297.1 dipeptidase [Pontibacter harenae]
MKLFAKGAAALALFCAAHSANAQNYQKIHQKAILVDTHNDVLINVLEGLRLEDDLRGKTHSDLARFKKGGVDVQFFSVWSDETYGKGKGFAYANRQIDSLQAIAARNPDKMVMVGNYQELMDAVKQGKLAGLVGVEGGHMIEDSIPYLDSLYNRGARYLTLTWNNSTSWASSAKDETAGTVPNAKSGLNEHGKQIVRRMNELGMMVDISHVGDQTFWDVINTSTKPVIASHSSVHNFCSHFRNLKDDQIKAIAKNGGVVQLNFAADFLDCGVPERQQQFMAKYKTEIDSLKNRGWSNSRIRKWLVNKYPKEATAVQPPLSVLLDHIDYIVKLVGVDYVGLGSDFDGISMAPQQLDGVEDYPLITKGLLTRGYSQQDINKILGGNLLRVFQANSPR